MTEGSGKKWDKKHEAIIEEFQVKKSEGGLELEVEKDQEEDNAWKPEVDKKGNLSKIVLDGYAPSFGEYFGSHGPYVKEKDYKQL